MECAQHHRLQLHLIWTKSRLDGPKLLTKLFAVGNMTEIMKNVSAAIGTKDKYCYKNKKRNNTVDSELSGRSYQLSLYDGLYKDGFVLQVLELSHFYFIKCSSFFLIYPYPFRGAFLHPELWDRMEDYQRAAPPSKHLKQASSAEVTVSLVGLWMELETGVFVCEIMQKKFPFFNKQPLNSDQVIYFKDVHRWLCCSI